MEWNKNKKNVLISSNPFQILQITKCVQDKALEYSISKIFLSISVQLMIKDGKCWLSAAEERKSLNGCADQG